MPRSRSNREPSRSITAREVILGAVITGLFGLAAALVQRGPSSNQIAAAEGTGSRGTEGSAPTAIPIAAVGSKTLAEATKRVLNVCSTTKACGLSAGFADAIELDGRSDPRAVANAHHLCVHLNMNYENHTVSRRPLDCHKMFSIANVKGAEFVADKEEICKGPPIRLVSSVWCSTPM